jgi:hypothetical protein
VGAAERIRPAVPSQRRARQREPLVCERSPGFDRQSYREKATACQTAAQTPRRAGGSSGRSASSSVSLALLDAGLSADHQPEFPCQILAPIRLFHDVHIVGQPVFKTESCRCVPRSQQHLELRTPKPVDALPEIGVTKGFPLPARRTLQLRNRWFEVDPDRATAGAVF